MNRILAAPFIVVKNEATGEYMLMFNLEGRVKELVVADSIEGFEEKLTEVFKPILQRPEVTPGKGPKV